MWRGKIYEINIYIPRIVEQRVISVFEQLRSTSRCEKKKKKKKNTHPLRFSQLNVPFTFLLTFYTLIFSKAFPRKEMKKIKNLSSFSTRVWSVRRRINRKSWTKLQNLIIQQITLEWETGVTVVRERIASRFCRRSLKSRFASQPRRRENVVSLKTRTWWR